MREEAGNKEGVLTDEETEKAAGGVCSPLGGDELLHEEEHTCPCCGLVYHFYRRSDSDFPRCPECNFPAC